MTDTAEVEIPPVAAATPASGGLPSSHCRPASLWRLILFLVSAALVTQSRPQGITALATELDLASELGTTTAGARAARSPLRPTGCGSAALHQRLWIRRGLPLTAGIAELNRGNRRLPEQAPSNRLGPTTKIKFLFSAAANCLLREEAQERLPTPTQGYK